MKFGILTLIPLLFKNKHWQLFSRQRRESQKVKPSLSFINKKYSCGCNLLYLAKCRINDKIKGAKVMHNKNEQRSIALWFVCFKLVFDF